MSARNFVCLTNIPTPYRLFQFARMCEHLGGRGWNFEVWFMAHSEPGRSWTFADSDFLFPHRFLRGRQFRIGQSSFHFNVEILHRLRQTKPDVLLVAGSWTNPTVWLAGMSSAANRMIFWSESHRGSIRHDNAAARLARRIVLGRFNEFAVPGTLARDYVHHYGHPVRIHRLRNLVNPDVFVNHFESAPKNDARTETTRRTLLVVARLTKEKGFPAFLGSLLHLNEADRSRLTVIIAGAGPLRRDLQSWIALHDLDIRMVGHQSESEMARRYRQADGFCLPSLSDPNPLSVIEAMWAGLPLLLSSRVGNHPECLDEGRNGFLFDPLSFRAAADAVGRWLALSPEELLSFGRRSQDVARSRFAPDVVIEQFLDDILEVPAVSEQVITSTTSNAKTDRRRVGV